MAGVAFAVVGDVDVFGAEAFGEGGVEMADEFVGEFDVDDFAVFPAVEVCVLGEVGAVAGGLAFEVDLADQVGFDEGFEAVVDGREGDGGHVAAGAGEDFIGGGVVAFFEQHGEDVFPLLGRALSAAGQGLVEEFLVFGGEVHGLLVVVVVVEWWSGGSGFSLY